MFVHNILFMYWINVILYTVYNCHTVFLYDLTIENWEIGSRYNSFYEFWFKMETPGWVIRGKLKHQTISNPNTE